MKVGSLFSGIGGIEIGFEKQGFTTEWFVEYEPYAKEILKKRFPNTKIYDDITKVDFETVPKVDILTGGFPCQDISNAGKRAGIEGSRSSLWKYYLKAIRILRPKFALIENVSALAKRGLNVVLADLAEIGYDAEWYNLSASAVGASHKRERIFILAYPVNDTDRTYKGKKGEEESISGISGQTRRPRLSCGTSEDVSNTSSIRCNKRSNNPLGETEDSKNRLSLQDNQEWEDWGRRSSSNDRGAGGNKDVPNTNNSRQQGNREDEIRQELLRSTEHSWTIEPELGRVADGIPNRIHRIKCLGNAVVPQVAEIFAEAIMECKDMPKLEK